MTLKHDPCFAKMAKVIQDKSKGEKVLFFSNPGNLGDALIFQGALAFMDYHNISYKTINTRNVLEKNKLLYPKTYWKHWLVNKLNLSFIRQYEPSLEKLSKQYKTAILCGSGGWVDVYPDTMKIAYLLSDHFDEIIIMPTTYGLEIKNPPQNMSFFVRDKDQSQKNNPKAQFCHDTAFFLQPENKPAVQEIGIHIRTDVESSGKIKLPNQNIDISALGTELSPAKIMFDEVSRSNTIITDRLHIAIAGVLLKRQTYLMKSRYYKIPAIFKASIKDNYNNAYLIEEYNDLPDPLKWA